MCGVYGISYNDRKIVEQMIKECGHRGPDGQNIYNDNKVTIGHNLLSITDSPTNSLQPWQLPNGNVLSYNGEIFNYNELCHKYKNSFTPRTNCDTEILAWGLDKFGHKFIDEIDSMHAFVFYNKSKQELMLSTDHLAIKPLYYATQNENIIFSSEIKNMLPHVKYSNIISKEGMACYQWCGMNILDQTLFNKIKKLIPGETITYDLYNKKIKNKIYCRIIPKSNNKFSASEFRQQVRKTVKMTSIGIRDFGIFLSGGLDSSIIAYEMNKINSKTKTFTNRFKTTDEKIDRGYNSDANVAKLLAEQEHFNHTEVLITPDTLTSYWEKCVESNEECNLNPNNFVYWYTNYFMKQNGVTITLAGDMGDELLTGYNKHFQFVSKYKIKNADQFMDFFKTLNSASPFHTDPLNFPVTSVINKFKKFYVEPLWNDEDPLGSYMAIECLTSVPYEFLRRNDKFGMANSIEGRFPFTTKSFMNYCFSIHSSEKFNLETGELKLPSKLAYADILPKEMLTKVKTGWTAPFGHWLDTHKSPKLFFQIPWNKKYGRGLKFYKKLFRKWIFKDWKRQHNIV